MNRAPPSPSVKRESSYIMLGYVEPELSHLMFQIVHQERWTAGYGTGLECRGVTVGLPQKFVVCKKCAVKVPDVSVRA